VCGIALPVYSAQAGQKFHCLAKKIYKYLFLNNKLYLFGDRLMAADILRRLGA
jgi:hypothetical protein